MLIKNKSYLIFGEKEKKEKEASAMLEVIELNPLIQLFKLASQ